LAWQLTEAKSLVFSAPTYSGLALGYLERCLLLIEETLAIARKRNHAFTIGWALFAASRFTARRRLRSKPGAPGGGRIADAYLPRRTQLMAEPILAWDYLPADLPSE
jgi:hypothetical protein